MSKQAFKRVRRALGLEVNREALPAFAWPGGYPLLYVFADGGCMCPKCANAEIEHIDDAMKSAAGNKPHRSGCGGWALAGVEPNYEDDGATCDNCGESIESAYGAPADDEQRAYGAAGAPESERENFGR